MIFRKELTVNQEILCRLLVSGKIDPAILLEKGETLFILAKQQEIASPIAFQIAQEYGWEIVPDSWRQEFEIFHRRIS